jgi:hypothetical protein
MKNKAEGKTEGGNGMLNNVGRCWKRRYKIMETCFKVLSTVKSSNFVRGH